MQKLSLVGEGVLSCRGIWGVLLCMIDPEYLTEGEGRRAGRQTDRQTDIQIDKYGDRQAGRQGD